MVLDECIEAPASHEQTQQAAARTLDWARRSKEAFSRQRPNSEGTLGQALFGIVQGGT